MYFKFSMKKRDFQKKSPAGFEPGTLRLQSMCLTPRLREMIQRGGGKYRMNQVLKSATLSKGGTRRFKIYIKRLKAPSKYLKPKFSRSMKRGREKNCQK